jgi:hypothetical protein
MLSPIRTGTYTVKRIDPPMKLEYRAQILTKHERITGGPVEREHAHADGKDLDYHEAERGVEADGVADELDVRQ